MNTYKITYTERRVHPHTGDKYDAWKGFDRVMATSPADARRKIIAWYANQGAEIVVTSCKDADRALERRVRGYERRRAYC